MKKNQTIITIDELISAVASRKDGNWNLACDLLNDLIQSINCETTTLELCPHELENVESYIPNDEARGYVVEWLIKNNINDFTLTN